MIIENIIPRNMVINLGCASVDNHIPRDDIFDYHPMRNVIFIYYHNAVTSESEISAVLKSINHKWFTYFLETI